MREWTLVQIYSKLYHCNLFGINGFYELEELKVTRNIWTDILLVNEKSAYTEFGLSTSSSKYLGKDLGDVSE